jgi:hypothetical protein
MGGVIREAEVDDARKYWTVYSSAVAEIQRAALRRTCPTMNETGSTSQNPTFASTK